MARNFPDLKEFRLEDLFRATESNETSIVWCRQLGLLKDKLHCDSDNCGRNRQMRLEKKSNGDGEIWRCSTGRNCRKQCSIRKDSFFANSHLDISTILRLCYMWCYEIDKQHFLMRELKINSNHSIIDWKQFCRDICHEYFIQFSIAIGGPGHIVEIGESCFVKRNHSHRVREEWVFGGYDVQTKQSFMVPVEKRDATTLLPVLDTFVLPGTTVVSDLWSKYDTVTNMGYTQLTVKHSINFVDPSKFAFTKNVESVWQKSEGKKKRSSGAHKPPSENYLAEFLWRQYFGDYPFHNFIEHLRMLYPNAAN